MSFKATSLAVAKEFLQTAVVVDDGLYSKSYEDTSPPEEIIDPTVLPVQTKREEAVAPDDEHRQVRRNLDADAVMSGFFREGIICAAIRPTSDHPITSQEYLRLLKKADLVVLDWNLVGQNGDDDAGEQAKEVIQQLVSVDDGGSRFRVIILYTGGTELGVADQAISDLLADKGFRRLDTVHRRDHTVIAVCAKVGGAVADQDEHRQFGEAELGSKCVDIFAEATRGLLSNAVLKGLALIRGESHRLLGRFNDKCDPAFLFHRMLTSPPSDVEDQVIPLIVSEIESILFELRANESISLERSEEYLEFRREADQWRPSVLSEDTDATFSALKDALKDGIEHSTVVQRIESLKADAYVSNQDRKTFNVALSDVFCQAISGSDGPDRESLEELAMLMSIQQRYGDLPPILGPGTILLEQSDPARYWLCVQPACDSVRLTGNRMFPLLKMTQPEGDQFDYIIRVGESKVKLRVSKRLYDATLVKFKPAEGFVRAKAEGGKFLFESVPENLGGSGKNGVTRKFEFAAQLKILHSIRETDKMTTELGRIGLTESEWSRRASKNS